ncbi:hypothetical protein BH09MYX1_BH09MYX1_05610 [soil metagenome]
MPPSRVLIAEDQAQVRRLAVRVLRAKGFEVLEAATGEEALMTLAAEGPVDLLLTDLVMPGMSGRELAERAVALHPSMKLLYTTGYTEDAVVRVGVKRREVAFLQKPFTVESLVIAVRRALEGAA